MPEKPLDSPSDFAQHVRDALTHLYDPVYLQTRPLARFVRPEAGARAPALGRALRLAIADAIENLRPAQAGPSTRADRTYQLLKLRYVEALDPPPGPGPSRPQQVGLLRRAAACPRSHRQRPPRALGSRRARRRASHFSPGIA